MLQFKYWTQKKKGASLQKKLIASKSISTAEKDLFAKQIPVLHIEPVFKKSKKGLIEGLFSNIPMQLKLTFAQQMESAFRSGMPIPECLDLAIELCKNASFKKALLSIRADTSAGKKLYECMEKTEVFDPLTLGLVRAGEEGGVLDKIFSQIKTIYARNEKIRKKLQGMMVYPTVLLIVSMLVVYALMVNTVPVFVNLYRSTNMQLPFATKVIIHLSDLCVKYPLPILGAIILISFCVIRLPSLYTHVPWIHKWILRIPLIGDIQKKLINETFIRTLLILMDSGMTLLESVSLCRNVSTCFEYKGAIARARLAIARGQSLKSSLEGDKDIFGALIVGAIAFGEKSGTVEEMLKPLSEALSDEIMQYLEMMTPVIESAMILVLGGFVMFILLAMFTPIFALPKLIHAGAHL